MFAAAIVKLVKNTHRHPINQALHCVGAPFYIVGLYMIIGHFANIQTNLPIGFAIWMSAVAMFVVGHKVEGNIMTMTPVLVARLLSRKVVVAANYFIGNHIHLFRA
jgi:hypothetical protein